MKKAIKAQEVEPDIIVILKEVLANNDEEKKLKKSIKEQSASLHMETKKFIEELSDDQVMELLNDKWIVPMTDSLAGLPDSIISDFISKLDKLSRKYDTTFSEVEDQIVETEKELSSMIDQLTGNEFDMQGLTELKNLLGGL